MNRAAVVILLIGALMFESSCDKSSKPRPSQDVVSTAVYLQLQTRLVGYNELSVWLSRDYDPASWQPRFDKEQAEIDRLRAWAEKLPRGVERDEYLEWLKYYYQYGFDSAREELRTRKEQREMEEYYKNSREGLDSARKLELPKPPTAQ